MILRLWLCCTYYTGIAPLAVLHLLHWYLAFSCVAPITLILRPWLCCSYYTGIVPLAVLHLLQ